MKKPTWLLAWDDEMSVGISELDDDQKHMFSLINDFNRSIAQGMKPEEIKNRLQLLIDDAVQHCQREEELLREWNYPGASDHALAHKHIREELQRMKDMFVPYDQDSSWLNTGQSIKNMLINHCLVEDMKFISYYKSKIGNEARP
jgi:hemerythrin